VDGPTDAAGAIADTGTCDRAREAGVGEVTAYLADNDAYHFFDRLGDLVRTGPTHTNVGDLQVVLLTPP
jgi:hydroxypyruvate reductase